MFALQIGLMKGRGGIATAIAHYERMFRALRVRSAVLFDGPSQEMLRRQGADVIAASRVLKSPLLRVLPVHLELRKAIRRRARGERIVAIVHSDKALPALRRVLPEARVVTPCHSDKFKHKGAADLVVTLNAAQDALARGALPRSRVALLGNPYVSPPPAALREGGPPRFNFVGRFIPTKDPLTLLRAAHTLADPSCDIRLIGAGELDEEVRRAAVELAINATFPGWLTAPFADFHRNDILVLPSRWEGLPYLLQEALDHGVPIIAADNPGNRAALGDGAYGALFPFGDAMALAERMRGAVADLDALKTKSEKGRAALHARYGARPFWRALSAELEQVGGPRHV